MTNCACRRSVWTYRRASSPIFCRRRRRCRSALAFTALYAVLLQWRFNEADLWLPLATPALVQLPLALLIGLMGQYLLEAPQGRADDASHPLLPAGESWCAIWPRDRSTRRR